MSPFTDEDVQSLARLLHEAGREAVQRALVLNKVPGQSFREWPELPEEAREGRRVQARFLLQRNLIWLKALRAHVPEARG
jgi:hypothetical protein